MATLVAVLLVCGRLASDLEVAALKASGVSPLRLFRPFLAVSIVATLLIAWLTLMVGPWSSGAFQRQLFRILQSRASTGIKERTFSATFNQFVIYVDEVSPSQVRLKGLLVSDERNPEQSRIIVAREGRLLSDEATRRITLRFLDGSISESDVGDRRRFRQTYFSLYDMSLPVDSPLTAASREEKPEKQLLLRQLISEADRLYREGQIATPYYVELHKRFALPVAALVFTLVGFPLGIRSHRGGRAVALGLSFGIVVSYYILYTSMEGIALRGRLPAGIAVWIPNAILALVGAAMLRAAVAGVSTAWLDAFWRLWAKIGERRSGRVAKPLEERRRRRLGRLTGPRESTFIMDRYLIRQYLIYLGIGTVIGAVLIGVVDLLQTLDRFLRVKPPFHHHPGALRLPVARRALQGLADDRADRHRVPVPLPHPAAGARRLQGGRHQPLPGEPAYLIGGGRDQRAGGGIPGDRAARHQHQVGGGGPGQDPRPAPPPPAAADPDLVPLLRHALLPHGPPRSPCPSTSTTSSSCRTRRTP